MSKWIAMLGVALIGLLLVVAACGQRYRNAAHPEYGQGEYDRDWYECQRENFHPQTRAATIGGPTVAYRYYPMALTCMRARGWQLEE